MRTETVSRTLRRKYNARKMKELRNSDLLGLVCVLPFICLLLPNHTNLNYLNRRGLYGEYLGINVTLLADCEPWGNMRYNYKVYIMLNIK